MTFISTPAPFRNSTPTAEDYGRRSLEQELWDSLANEVFMSSAPTLKFVMPVEGRVEIMARADLDIAGDITLSLDSTAITPSSFGVPGSTVIAIAAPDVSTGKHTITLSSIAGAVISDPVIILRRGRKGN